MKSSISAAARIAAERDVRAATDHLPPALAALVLASVLGSVTTRMYTEATVAGSAAAPDSAGHAQQPPQSTGPAWISTSHAAARLGISRVTVLKLVQGKRLRGRRPRHKWQVCAASVEAYRRRIENGA